MNDKNDQIKSWVRELIAKHVTECVKPGCGKEQELKDMVKNVHGAGYVCKEHAKSWNSSRPSKKEYPPLQ